MKISYEGTDVLYVDIINDQKIVLAAIACTKQAEDKLYDWQIHYMNRTGKEIGTIRTIFGLTFYAQEEQEQIALKTFVKEQGFETYYGQV